MSTVQAYSRAVKRIGKQVARQVVRGAPSRLVPLGAATLDAQDVAIAKSWLQRNPDEWDNESVIRSYHEAFAHFNGSEYAFSFMGGRVALSAIIHALGLQPGDSVVVPGYTCVVVPNAFHYAGVDVIYADIELDTYGLDANSFEERIAPSTKAVLLHHLYGLVARDYERVLEIARARKLYVIEDCAHATGAMFKNRRIGNLGDVAFYSSEQSKVFTTIQGGIATTNNATIAKGLEGYYERAPYPSIARTTELLNAVGVYRDKVDPSHVWWINELKHATFVPPVSTTVGELEGIRPTYYGEKMPAPLAAIGIHQINKLDRYNQSRRETAKRWDLWCRAHSYPTPFVLPESNPVYLRYPVLVEPEKKANKSWMATELKVEPGVWFVSHVHPSHSIQVTDCPNASIAVAQCVNFPCLVDPVQ